VGGTRTDQWGTGPAGDQPPAAAPGDAEGAPVESNTASLWVLVAAGYLTPASFICPSTTHLEDTTVSRYDEVRDFRGDRFLSYSYQNVLGEYALSETASLNASQLAVAADSSPLRRDWRTRAGTPGATDAEMARKPEFLWSDAYPSWRGPVAGPWELNSPNHRFAGQNVLYLDGHVAWVETPYCGLNLDNIWLRRTPGAEAPPDGGDLEAVRRTNDTDSYDGKSTLPPGHGDDSFLVP
jgi:prepilin-type processing-associated H-X9-DG protein